MVGKFSLLRAHGMTLCCFPFAEEKHLSPTLSTASVPTTIIPEMFHLLLPHYFSYYWAHLPPGLSGTRQVLNTAEGRFLSHSEPFTETAGGWWEAETPPSHLAASYLPCSSWHGGGRGQRRAIARAGGQTSVIHLSPFYCQPQRTGDAPMAK